MEGRYIKNEKQRGLILPPMLKEFLIKYGYLPVNRGILSCYSPDYMELFTVETEDEDGDICIIGNMAGIPAAVRLEDMTEDNPPLLSGNPHPEEESDTVEYWTWEFSGLHLQDFLSFLFLKNLTGDRNFTRYEDEAEIKELFRLYHVDKDLILESGCQARLCDLLGRENENSSRQFCMKKGSTLSECRETMA